MLKESGWRVTRRYSCSSLHYDATRTYTSWTTNPKPPTTTAPTCPPSENQSAARFPSESMQLPTSTTLLRVDFSVDRRHLSS